MSLPSKPLPPNPDLVALLEKAKAAFESMSPEQQREMKRAQRESWVVGEMMLEHPEMTRAEAKAIYEKVVF